MPIVECLTEKRFLDALPLVFHFDKRAEIIATLGIKRSIALAAYEAEKDQMTHSERTRTARHIGKLDTYIARLHRAYERDFAQAGASIVLSAMFAPKAPTAVVLN